MTAKKFINHIKFLADRELDYKFTVDELAYLERFLIRQLIRLPIYFRYYVKFFGRHKLKVLLIEDASYGGDLVPIIVAAKRCGIKVAEYQHGAISQGHDAYNVSDTIAACKNFRITLPDYLLTYGTWWSQQCNLPVDKISIGNPFRTERLKKMSAPVSSRKKILVLGDGYETAKYLNLTEKIREITLDRDLDVLFRPHPFEKHKVSNAILPYGVTLDLSSDIYDSLQNAELVVSEVSTGLFEAIGLAKNILIWETKKTHFNYPNLPFTSFSSHDELKLHIGNILNSNPNASNVNLSDLWAPDWQKNLNTFIENIKTDRNE